MSRIGNRAVHDHRAIPETASLTSVQELFHICYWLAHTYGRTTQVDPGLAFDVAEIPSSALAASATAEKLQELEAALAESDEKLTARRRE